MQTYKRDILSLPEEDLRRFLPQGESISMRFQVVPLDTNVEDMSTPEMFLSNSIMFVVYDETIELYDINSLELEITGEHPKFSLIPLLLEGSYVYANGAMESLMKLRQSEFVTRLTITEPQQIPKEYLLRRDMIVAKSYQTWAFARMVLNHKHRIPSDIVLNEMISGSFIGFDLKILLRFIIFIVGYFIVRVLLIPLLPAFIGSLADVFMGVVLLVMGYWIWNSASKNLSRYSIAYRSHTFSNIDNSTEATI